jgi:hypothetical protein
LTFDVGGGRLAQFWHEGRGGLRRVLSIAVVAAAVCAAIPGASSAAGPVLQSASLDQSTKVLSVTWSLPPGVESRVLEANTNPALDSEGYFLFGPNDGYYGPNIIFEVPDSSATSWLHSYPDLPPGHYYVHVGGFDSNCTSCPIREWSTLGTFDVNAPPPPPPPPPPPAKKVFAPDCSGRPHYRPRSIIVACGDGNLQLLRLRWSGWTTKVATAAGVFHWNDCKPACYLGHFHSRSGAHVKLFRVTWCRSKRFLQFTRMRVTPPKSLPRFKPFTQRLSCTVR